MTSSRVAACGGVGIHVCGSGAWCNFDKVNVRRSVGRPNWHCGRSTKMGCNRCDLTSFVTSIGKLAFRARRLNRETWRVLSKIPSHVSWTLFSTPRGILLSELSESQIPKSRIPIRRDISKKHDSSLIYLLIQRLSLYVFMSKGKKTSWPRSEQYRGERRIAVIDSEDWILNRECLPTFAVPINKYRRY